jgi:hypothetical protein
VCLEGHVGSRCEVALSPVLVHLELHRSDALVYPGVGHAQDGIVWEIHVRDSVTDVRWVAWELLVLGAVSLWYFGPAEKQSSCLGRCGFCLVEKSIVKYMKR